MNIDLSFIQFDIGVKEEFIKICQADPGCGDCPLKIGDKEINGTIIHCNTGRGDM